MVELLQGLVGLDPAGTGPRKLPRPIPRGLIQEAAEPVPLGPQLSRGQPAQVQAARGVDRQVLVAGAGQGLGQLQVAVRLLAVGQVQLR